MPNDIFERPSTAGLIPAIRSEYLLNISNRKTAQTKNPTNSFLRITSGFCENKNICIPTETAKEKTDVSESAITDEFIEKLAKKVADVLMQSADERNKQL